MRCTTLNKSVAASTLEIDHYPFVPPNLSYRHFVGKSRKRNSRKNV